MEHPFALELKGIAKRFGSARKPVPVLNGIDLVVHRGDVFALLGPNGAGKTTLVRILATLLRPDGGTARVAGVDVVHDAARVRERISLTGQHAAVDLKLSGAENLSQMGRLAHLSRRDNRQRVDDLLDAFDLAGAADRRAGSYSGGMRRRLDLAAGLLVRPEVMFLDEPTTGLDPRSRQALWDIIRAVVADGTTVLLTTQYLEEADSLADRIALIDGGRITAEGTATDLKRRVGDAGVELTFDGVEAAQLAAAALGVVLPGAPHHVSTTLRIATDASVGHVRSVLEAIDSAGVTPVRWDLRSPTLDDVFLVLTGQSAADPAPAARHDSAEIEVAA